MTFYRAYSAIASRSLLPTCCSYAAPAALIKHWTRWPERERRGKRGRERKVEEGTVEFVIYGPTNNIVDIIDKQPQRQRQCSRGKWA